MVAESGDMSVESGVKVPRTEGRAGEIERLRRVARFFERLLKAGSAVQPVAEWDKAREAYADVEVQEGGPAGHLVNLWRVKVDTQAAFMDSEPAQVRFMPPLGLTDNELARVSAEVCGDVWEYLNRELRYQETFEAFRHSADVCNVGFVANVPNMVRWLPDIMFLRPEQVAIDGGCGDDLRQARWVAFWTLVSPEELAEWFPGAGVAPFRAAVEKRGVKTVAKGERGEEQEELTETAGRSVLHMCKVWRVFLRGSYAMYDRPPESLEPTSEDKRPGAEVVTGSGERRRYVLLVEGVDVPLIDRMGWPELLPLDDGEWPITMLRYNRTQDNIYGFTDYRHERGLLAEIERVVSDIVERHGLEGLKVGTADGSNLSREAVIKWLGDRGIQCLENSFDQIGNPKVRVLDVRGTRSDDIAYLTLLLQLYDQISMLPRVARGDEDPNKTATASQLEHDTATARAHRRLAMYEAARAEVARKVMQMAHVMLPALTQVAMPSEDGDESIQAVRWGQAEGLLLSGGRLVALGTEAICGDKALTGWFERPEDIDDAAFREMVLRSVRVSVERGSTSSVARGYRVKQLQEVLQTVIMPAAQAVGAPAALVEAAKRILALYGLTEFDTITEKLDAALEQGQAEAGGQAGVEGLNAGV